MRSRFGILNLLSFVLILSLLLTGCTFVSDSESTSSAEVPENIPSDTGSISDTFLSPSTDSGDDMSDNSSNITTEVVTHTPDTSDIVETENVNSSSHGTSEPPEPTETAETMETTETTNSPATGTSSAATTEPKPHVTSHPAPSVTSQLEPSATVETEPITTQKNEQVTDPSGGRDYSSIVPASNQFVIIYEPNGGYLGSALANSSSVKDSATGKIVCTKKDDYFYQTVTDSYYLCPHAMGDKNYLRRDGYVLYGYNTSADGSGTYYGCGWNVPIQKSEKIVLYAMWAKASDASLFTFSSGTITKYTGNEDTVVIPTAINGTPVTAVASGAFSGKNMTTVIMPSCLTTLESNAFNNCLKLKTVYQFDKITTMPNDTFSNCPNFSTLIINNAQRIKYIGSQKEGSYHMKFQRLLLNRDEQKIIFISGSNAVYGLLSPVVESNLGNKYKVINYGTNYYVPSSIYIDIASKFVKNGDIVAILPEEVSQQWGDNQTTAGYAQFFPAIEGCMEIISYLDMRNYSNMFSFIAKHNNSRAAGKNSYESVYSEAVDQYGDFSYIRNSPSTSKWKNSALQDWFGPKYRNNFFTAYNVANLNRSFDLCVSAGAKVYISFSVVDKSYVTDYSNENLQAYEDSVTASYITGRNGRYLISRVADYIFEHKYFYNSMHHLLTDASRVRSELLARDIQAQLSKEN